MDTDTGPSSLSENRKKRQGFQILSITEGGYNDLPAYILAELKKLEQTAPQDSVVTFFAGHGIMVGSHFVFLPVDAKVGSREEVAKTGIGSDVLSAALTAIPATSQFVILDCCQSGGASSDFERIRAQQKLARQSGTFMIAAAAADQSANEFPSLHHGLLTFSVLDGLGDRKAPAAALDGQKTVTVNSLMDYVSHEVPRLTEKLQALGQDVVLFTTGQDFPLHRP